MLPVHEFESVLYYRRKVCRTGAVLRFLSFLVNI